MQPSPKLPTCDATAAICELVSNGRTDEAVTRLMGEHKDALFRYCALLLCNTELAKDATQATFIKAYRDLSRFRGEGTVVGWLFRIATNTSLNLAKSQRRWRGSGSLEWVEDIPDGQATSDQVIASRQVLDLLAAALRKLPAHKRAPLILRYVSGWEYSEISEAVNEKEAAVRKRCERALAQLKNNRRLADAVTELRAV